MAHNAFDLHPPGGKGIVKVENVSLGVETEGKVTPELAVTPRQHCCVKESSMGQR